MIEKTIELDFEQELYKYFGQVKDFTLGMAIAKRFYKLGKEHQGQGCKELEDEIIRYVGYPQEIDEDISTTMVRKAARHFANWYKEQMMKGAVDGEIKVIYRDAVKAESVGFSTQKTGLFEGDKVKLIVIKED